MRDPHPTAGTAGTGTGTAPVNGSATGSGTQAVDRAALLVSTVVQADEPLGFADLQEECGLAKSTTSRMLAALERTGLLERNDGGSYVAGRLFWLYAARHDPWEELVRLARPTLEAIGEATQETVHLSVVRGHRVVQVVQVDSRYLLGTRDWTEIDVPAHCSALGKLFLAHGAIPLPEEPLEPATERTLVDLDDLRRDGERTRRRGWASTVDELELGLSGLAVPVLGRDDALVAALGVSGPTTRLQHRLDELGAQLQDHAAQLSTLLRGRSRKEGVA